MFHIRTPFSKGKDVYMSMYFDPPYDAFEPSFSLKLCDLYTRIFFIRSIIIIQVCTSYRNGLYPINR